MICNIKHSVMKTKSDSKAQAGANEPKKEEKTDRSITIDMPEVKDIPGQEHVKVPRIREMEDTTISSADEEGEGILDDLNTDDQQEITNDSNVSKTEKKLLKKSAAFRPNEETEDFEKMVLDERDDDGDLLNEASIRQDRNGEDLDVPGADLDDDNEDIGEEDEENNTYSQSQRDPD